MGLRDAAGDSLANGLSVALLPIVGFAVKRQFLLRVFLAPHAQIGEGQLIVGDGIRRFELYRSFQGRHSFRGSAPGNERPAQSHEGLGELRIDFCRAAKVLDGLIPLATFPRHLAQFVLGRRVVRVDRDLGLKLLTRLFSESCPSDKSRRPIW